MHSKEIQNLHESLHITKLIRSSEIRWMDYVARMDR
jgi:hypothetical protein